MIWFNYDERWKSFLKVYLEENLDYDIKRYVNYDMSNICFRNCWLYNVLEVMEVGYIFMSFELIEVIEVIGFIIEYLKWEDWYGLVCFIDFFYNDNVVNIEKYIKIDFDVYELLKLFM